MLTLIGQTIRAIKAEPSKNKYKEVKYILFDDGKTYLEFEEQDYSDYHDCSTSARWIHVRESDIMWDNIYDYPDANSEI